VFAHLETFAGKPVVDFSGESYQPSDATVPRLRIEYDSGQTAVELFGDLLATGTADRLSALVVGAWSDELSTAGSAAHSRQQRPEPGQAAP
jgi:hypothetical protein